MTVATFAAKSAYRSAARRGGAPNHQVTGCAWAGPWSPIAAANDGLCAALLARDLGVTLGVCELSFTFVDQ